MTPLNRTVVLHSALLLAAGGTLAVSLPAASSEAATTPTLCKEQTAPVASRTYTVENNEWGSSQPECITTDGGSGFSVAKSSIANSTSGAPGGYAAIYRGCHWGACTPGSGFPIRVSNIHPGRVTTSWSTAQPGGSNAYDVAYDIWFNQTPTTTGQPNGTELMVWLNHNGAVQPFGAKVASNVSVGGRSYDVWFGQQGWNVVSYTMNPGTTSISNMDLRPLIANAVSRGYISPSWYLIDVEAGFEIWNGGKGLATKSFSVHVTGHPAPTPSPIASSASPSPSTTPSSSASPSSSAMPSSAPSSTPSASPSSSSTPSSSPDISLQAISPNTPASGTSTNVTVDFKNVGSTVASNLTLVTKVRNSAGTVVGREAETGQDVAPQQTANLSYPWPAASAGTYSIDGIVRDSSGKTLERAKVGTITVK